MQVRPNSRSGEELMRRSMKSRAKVEEVEREERGKREERKSRERTEQPKKHTVPGWSTGAEHAILFRITDLGKERDHEIFSSIGSAYRPEID